MSVVFEGWEQEGARRMFPHEPDLTKLSESWPLPWREAESKLLHGDDFRVVGRALLAEMVADRTTASIEAWEGQWLASWCDWGASVRQVDEGPSDDLYALVCRLRDRVEGLHR